MSGQLLLPFLVWLAFVASSSLLNPASGKLVELVRREGNIEMPG
ncbi:MULTISPECIES: hypothetical protein [Rhizobium]|uniref:Uncharacterized protein n=1 Tax=Rhizobium tumorigenes TaxID=2041385 RepID=A0AAF1KQ26_9HYPH|nr:MULTISPECIES: hypothetical protein [Rhizobium]WFR98256.1 hypothetical protein PR017_23175 [Rhizobium tumorigenes]WFS03768.1 hypothetical protein PR016_23605 [Rhizobium tumorigenes]